MGWKLHRNDAKTYVEINNRNNNGVSKEKYEKTTETKMKMEQKDSWRNKMNVDGTKWMLTKQNDRQYVTFGLSMPCHRDVVVIVIRIHNCNTNLILG